MNDEADLDAELAALGAASDQLNKLGEAIADELASFYLRLLHRGVPATLAKTMALNHQAHRYGWETGE